MNKRNLTIILLIGLLTASCGVYNSLMSLSKLKFKLGEINNFRVGNIAISNKSKLSDFGALDIVKLTSSVVSGEFPVSFTVNVLAKNPNKSSSSSSINDITLESFPWKLFINDKETISGNISNPVNVPSVEDATVIPLDINLNMKEFFKGDALNDLINLALQLGGSNGSTSNLKLIAEPVLGTPLGNMSYPSPLTIIDKSFN